MKLIEFKQVRFGNEEVIGDIIPPEKLFEDYENITSIPLRSIKISEEEFCSKFIEAFKETVLETWDKSKYHIILHSSGYDSRMLSWTIKKLNLKNLIYVCLFPEGSEFAKIMRYISNGNDYLTAPRLGTKHGLNAIRYANNERPIDNIQIYSCGYFNELLSYGFFENNHNFSDWINKYYYHTYAKNAADFPGNIFYPILGEKVLKVVLTSDITLNLDLHHKIIKTADPKLFSFRRYQDKK